MYHARVHPYGLSGLRRVLVPAQAALQPQRNHTRSPPHPQCISLAHNIFQPPAGPAGGRPRRRAAGRDGGGPRRPPGAAERAARDRGADGAAHRPGPGAARAARRARMHTEARSSHISCFKFRHPMRLTSPLMCPETVLEISALAILWQGNGRGQAVPPRGRLTCQETLQAHAHRACRPIPYSLGLSGCPAAAALHA